MSERSPKVEGIPYIQDIEVKVTNPPQDRDSMVPYHNTTWRHNPEDLGLNFHRREIIKSQVTQLIKKFLTFYGTRRFITMFTRARHWSLFL
jgi:hypothetical protein